MTDATATLIKMEGVKKVFYTDEVETHALSEIHLEIKKGQYISIAGPSGCGKSTLLSILGLLDSPTRGEYTLNGSPVANLSISERTRIRNREIVCMVTHGQRYANFAERTIHLFDGRIVEETQEARVGA